MEKVRGKGSTTEGPRFKGKHLLHTLGLFFKEIIKRLEKYNARTGFREFHKIYPKKKLTKNRGKTPKELGPWKREGPTICPVLLHRGIV